MLDPINVQAARAVEVGFYREMKTFVEVPVSACWNKTGRAPIKTRWIDHNKGGARRMTIIGRD